MPDTARAGANMRTGGQILAHQLRLHGCDTAFFVAGECSLELLDALYDHKDFKRYTCRNETGRANAEEAYGKLTGKPGVVMVTRGPGACHGVIGLHTAHQDSTPMIMLIGQVARDQFDREAFQEIDYRRMLGQVTKWTAQIESVDRVPEYLARAFSTAMSGRPGPVALALPEDMLRDMTAAGDADPYKTVRPGVDPDEMAALQNMLAQAPNPLMIVGGGGWNQKACNDIVAYAEANNLPTTASFRCQDLFDNNHANYVGELGTSISAALSKRVEESDLLLVIGARLGEMTTKGYSIVEVPRPKQKIIHVYPDPDEIGRVYQADLAIAAGVDKFAAAACKARPVASPNWGDWVQAGRQAYLDNLKPSLAHPGPVAMWPNMQEIAAQAPAAVITRDAGNISGRYQQFWKYRRIRTQVPPTSGSIGHCVPSEI